jgi:hypothetical protein
VEWEERKEVAVLEVCHQVCQLECQQEWVDQVQVNLLALNHSGNSGLILQVKMQDLAVMDNQWDLKWVVKEEIKDKEECHKWVVVVKEVCLKWVEVCHRWVEVKEACLRDFKCQVEWEEWARVDKEEV